MAVRTRVAIAGVMWLGLAVPGLRPVPHEDGRTSPGPQSSHALVYDERLQRVVLLSGHRGSMPDATEVWTWDGRNWEQLPYPGPPARYLAGAAYDTERNRIVLFGGRVGKEGFTKDDTWEWDGTAWRDASNTSPGIREHHSMAYDEHRRRTVIYGGTVPQAGVAPRQQTRREWPADVWEWDGARWHRIVAAGPGSRNGTALAYDRGRRQIVLFGGVGEDSAYRTGTWTWNGTSWRQAAVDGPPLRASHQLVYDSRREVVLLYGGAYGDRSRTERFEDMWQWDGAQWTRIALTGPAPGERTGHAMAYDRSRGRTVLFGGFGKGVVAVGDTWEWDGARWLQIQ